MNQIFYITIYMSVKEKGNPEKGVCRVHMDIHNPNGIQKLLDELPEAVKDMYEQSYDEEIEAVGFISEEEYEELEKIQKSKITYAYDGDSFNIEAKTL